MASDERLRLFLNEIVELATRADEAGFVTLSLALLLIVRGAKQHRRLVRRSLVNTGSLMLDTVEEARTVDRRDPGHQTRKANPTCE